MVQRLLPQIMLASDNGLLPERPKKQFEELFKRVSDFFPKEKASLLHGDLWRGNYMTRKDGQPVVFDPAVYYGHRYMDLGMTKLFGGFPESFYYYYNEAFPLHWDWNYGAEVANLYPLMVHLNMFGASYFSRVNKILERFA